MLAHTFNINTESFVLSDFVSLGRSFVDRNQQVLNLFVVNFHHRDIDFVLLVFVRVFGNSVENLLASDGDDSLNVSKDTLLAP